MGSTNREEVTIDRIRHVRVPDAVLRSRWLGLSLWVAIMGCAAPVETDAVEPLQQAAPRLELKWVAEIGPPAWNPRMFTERLLFDEVGDVNGDGVADLSAVALAFSFESSPAETWRVCVVSGSDGEFLQPPTRIGWVDGWPWLFPASVRAVPDGGGALQVYMRCEWDPMECASLSARTMKLQLEPNGAVAELDSPWSCRTSRVVARRMADPSGLDVCDGRDQGSAPIVATRRQKPANASELLHAHQLCWKSIELKPWAGARDVDELRWVIPFGNDYEMLSRPIEEPNLMMATLTGIRSDWTPNNGLEYRAYLRDGAALRHDGRVERGVLVLGTSDRAVLLRLELAQAGGVSVEPLELAGMRWPFRVEAVPDMTGDGWDDLVVFGINADLVVQLQLLCGETWRNVATKELHDAGWSDSDSLSVDLLARERSDGLIALLFGSTHDPVGVHCVELTRHVRAVK